MRLPPGGGGWWRELAKNWPTRPLSNDPRSLFESYVFASKAANIHQTYTVVTICPGARGIRFSWAIQIALTPSYNAVPSMFTVAPRGRTKRLIRRSILFFSSRQRIVVGKVAELRIKETVTRSLEKSPHLHLQPHILSLCLVEKKSSLYWDHLFF